VHHKEVTGGINNSFGLDGLSLKNGLLQKFNNTGMKYGLAAIAILLFLILSAIGVYIGFTVWSRTPEPSLQSQITSLINLKSVFLVLGILGLAGLCVKLMPFPGRSPSLDAGWLANETPKTATRVRRKKTRAAKETVVSHTFEDWEIICPFAVILLFVVIFCAMSRKSKKKNHDPRVGAWVGDRPRPSRISVAYLV